MEKIAHILVVDDDEFLAEVTGEIISTLGYRVTVVTDSAKALELLVADPSGYDVLITDLTMPGISGLELVEKVRLHNTNLPVILCTGYSSQVNPRIAEQLKINKFCMKPLTMEEIEMAITEVLSKKNTGRA